MTHDLEAKLNEAISRHRKLLGKAEGSVPDRPQTMQPVITGIKQLMAYASLPSIELVEPSGPTVISLRFTSKSTIITSTVLHVPNNKQFHRTDFVDLNLPKAIFVIAGKDPSDSQQRHEFLYSSAQEVLDAYADWFGWAVAVHTREQEGNDGTA